MRPSAYFVIAGNLIPLFMSMLGGWDANQILPLYWAESAIVGFYTIIRILIAQGPIMKLNRNAEAPEDFTAQNTIPGGPYSSLAMGAKAMLCAFFLFHFGAFMFGHGMFLFGFILQGAQFGPAKVDPMDVSLWLAYLGPLKWALIALFASHGVSFIMNYVRGGEYRAARPSDLMMRPYSRLMVMHLAILAGAFVAMKIPSENAGPALFFFVILKVVTDVRAHSKEHAAAAAPVRA